MVSALSVCRPQNDVLFNLVLVDNFVLDPVREYIMWAKVDCGNTCENEDGIFTAFKHKMVKKGIILGLSLVRLNKSMISIRVYNVKIIELTYTRARLVVNSRLGTI